MLLNPNACWIFRSHKYLDLLNHKFACLQPCKRIERQLECKFDRLQENIVWNAAEIECDYQTCKIWLIMNIMKKSLTDWILVTQIAIRNACICSSINTNGSKMLINRSITGKMSPWSRTISMKRFRHSSSLRLSFELGFSSAESKFSMLNEICLNLKAMCEHAVLKNNGRAINWVEWQHVEKNVLAIWMTVQKLKLETDKWRE